MPQEEFFFHTVSGQGLDLGWENHTDPVLHKFLPGEEKQRWYKKKHFKDNVLDNTHKLDQMEGRRVKGRQSLKQLEACASDQNESPSGKMWNSSHWGGGGGVHCVDVEHNFRIKGHSRPASAIQDWVPFLPQALRLWCWCMFIPTDPSKLSWFHDNNEFFKSN